MRRDNVVAPWARIGFAYVQQVFWEGDCGNGTTRSHVEHTFDVPSHSLHVPNVRLRPEGTSSRSGLRAKVEESAQKSSVNPPLWA